MLPNHACGANNGYNCSMSTPILTTKLYIPPPRLNVVLRPRLLERLNEGLHRKLTLISAPAGFGKTTLLSAWVASRTESRGLRTESVASSPSPQSSVLSTRVAWLSLDEGDSDPTRFLAYLVAALRTIAVTVGEGVQRLLQAPQPPATESILTVLLNDISSIPGRFVLVLDDYHVIDAKPIDTALSFLLEHLPPQMHLVIATREDPNLPLARLRARDQLTELRVADLRFTLSEAAEFLNQAMGLKLSIENIAALEERIEGWIAGLQLAALSMQGQKDTAGFIQSFSGSHHFVMDYLLEEVLCQQPASIQTFLLRTSILNRLCGPLCDAVFGLTNDQRPTTNDRGDSDSSFIVHRSSFILEELERANLFIIPLDNERRWYRYHHLFAELLRQRLHQGIASSMGEAQSRINELHIRASQWYEDNGLEIEAFHHAAAGNDIERAERLIEGKGMPRHFRGAVTTILAWLGSLPTTVLDARPALWWRHASLLLMNGQTTGVEEKLQAAEAALQGAEADDTTRNLIGRIAAARATLALTRYDVGTMLAQSHRALEYLHPNNLSTQANANWTLGVAYSLQGDRAAARRAYAEAIALSEASGDNFTTILATLGLGNVQEADNKLYLAAETYRRILQLASDQPLQIIGEVHLGLAHILYEWNDLDGAEQHGRQSLDLERQYEGVIDRYVICEVFLARLKLAQGDVTSAAAMLAQAAQSARQQNFVHRIPEVAAAQVLVLLRQGNLAAAAQLAETHQLPISQARVHLAQGDASAALVVLGPLRQQAEAKDWQDERLKVMVLQAVAHHAHGDTDKAVQLLGDTLALAELEGFIRLFVDEGSPMAELLSQSVERRAQNDPIASYAEQLLSAFPEARSIEHRTQNEGTAALRSSLERSSALVEPLSQRELQILHLVAQGLSNLEIGERLLLALSTVKGHNRIMFDKLQVKNRTEAVARARELGLL
jgi:LuxR family maltose regulon positive regulatory protein